MEDPDKCETCGEPIVYPDDCDQCLWCGEPLCANDSGRHYADCDCCHGPHYCPAMDGEEGKVKND